MFGTKIFLILVFYSVMAASLPINDPEDKKGPISSYNFKYAVDDRETGDHKSHQETMEGGVVKGFYTVQEADGSFREVHYSADKEHGFRAVVKNSSKSPTPGSDNFHKHVFNHGNDGHVFYPYHHSIHHPCTFAG